MTGSKPDLFRSEALDHYSAQRTQTYGHPLRLSPEWTGWAYWLLLAAAGIGLVFLVLMRLPEYARGPAVIWLEHTVVTARTAGTVVSVWVRPYQSVQANDPLLNLDDAPQAAALEKVRYEFDVQLVRYLFNPEDSGARSALRVLAAEKGLATAQREERCVRAPHAGTVVDVRFRPGQHCQPGDLLVTLTDPEGSSGCTVLAVLPAQFRPFLREGMPLRLELSGFRYAYQTARIEGVDQEAMGPLGVRRFLGPEIGDALPLTGASVMVRARLRDASFQNEGQTCRLSHGMLGEAAVAVRSRRMVSLLFPWWKVLQSGTGG